MHPDTVVDFWFAELTPAQWWRVDAALDETIRTRFGAVHRAAGAGELACWRETAHGRLAEVIVLDQFSRNLYRGSAAAFAGDGMALVLAQEAVRAGADQALPVARRAFFYLPWMHSESLRLHDEALRRLFEHEKNAIELVKCKEMLDLLELATDACEDVANALESVVVKHG